MWCRHPVDLAGAPYKGTVWTVTGLPPGLRFDNVMWGIVGTPTTAGTYNVTLEGDHGLRRHHHQGLCRWS